MYARVCARRVVSCRACVCVCVCVCIPNLSNYNPKSLNPRFRFKDMEVDTSTPRIEGEKKCMQRTMCYLSWMKYFFGLESSIRSMHQFCFIYSVLGIVNTSRVGPSEHRRIARVYHSGVIIHYCPILSLVIVRECESNREPSALFWLWYLWEQNT